MPPGFSPASALRELARDIVLAALRAEEAEATLDGEAHAMVRRACQAARGGDARVEQLLVHLKDAWRELPAGRVCARVEGPVRLERLVTSCIKEYYGTAGRRQ